MADFSLESIKIRTQQKDVLRVLKIKNLSIQNYLSSVIFINESKPEAFKKSNALENLCPVEMSQT